MTVVEGTATRAGELPALAFDTDSDLVVGEHREARLAGLRGRDRLAALLVGGAFLATALALAVVLPAHQHPGPVTVAVYVAVYAVAATVEFEVFTGASVPTQLVLVPMLLVLPLGLVPLAVGGGLLLASLVDGVGRRVPLIRSARVLVGGWHAVGAVAVLAAAGGGAARWSWWPVYLGALAAQFAFELGSVALAERIARGTSLRELVPHLGRVQLVDAMLAPVGLALAFVARDERYAILLVLPLVALLRVFARERLARIDHALELSAAYRGTAFLLGDVVEADDAYTGLHSRDVVELSLAVADQLGVSSADRRDTEFVALLHDVGKIRIPAEIINKPGALTSDERRVIETHTIEGERLLEQVGGLLGRVGRIVRSCHERWDGRGYPDGLAGEAIPLVARIVMCCDAFSAMTTDRSYRKALSLPLALEELRANAGAQFDQAVVDALVRVVEQDAVERSVR